jgi:glutaminyl-peptide cyclotransferase
MINEIEWVESDGRQFIYANVWQTKDIVKISLDTGRVALRFVMNKMAVDSRRQEHGGQQDVLNGIAFDEERQLFVLTGKKWPKYYVAELE